jgi:outer membrane receptor protein involved in Fe transport
MKRIIQSIAIGSSLFAASALLAPHDADAQGAGVTQGNLRGLVRDKAQKNAPAVGATVVATSPALQGEQVVITDENGQYFITSLPPGVYVLTIYVGDAKFERGNVLIQVGKEAVVNVNVDSEAGKSKGKGEVIEISGNAPVIDQGSQKLGVTITDDYTRNIPVGRTFGSVLESAAGATGDAFGISISGSTSVENTYIVEGINTTDTAFGALSSNLPNEFVSETEIITGGYDAEYGRATGGVVNVVTKQGSNEFHGSVFGYWTPGALVATSKVIPTNGGAIAVQDTVNNQYDGGFELGGPIIKDKVWFHVGFAPSVINTTETRIIQRLVDKNQDGVPDVDKNGFSLHENVTSQDLPAARTTYFFTSKINAAVNQNNQGQLSIFGNPRIGDDFVNDPRWISNPLNSRFDETTGAYDVSAKWTSKFNEGKTQVDAVVGYHHGFSYSSVHGTGLEAQNGGDALTQYGYTRPLTDFADLEGNIDNCNDAAASNPYPKLRRLCPVLNYSSSGIGGFTHRDNDRSTAVLSMTQRVKAGALGYHTFKAGLDYELATYNQTTQYTGSSDDARESLQRSCNTDTATGLCSTMPIGTMTGGGTGLVVPGTWQQNTYYTVTRALTPAEQMDPNFQPPAGQHLCNANRALCGYSDKLAANTIDQSLGAFIQDSWQIRPNFTVNVGARYEQLRADYAKQLQGLQTPVGETIPKTGFTLDQWAPRVGFNWDPTQEGRAKIFGHYGQFYENVPMDLNVRSYGGEIDSIALYNGQQLVPGQMGYNPACNVDYTNKSTFPSQTLKGCKDLAQQAVLGSFEFTAPNLQGQYLNEYIIGGEYELMGDLKAGLSYQHRDIGRVIEDTLTPNGEYFIVNPARDYTVEANQLMALATAEMAAGNKALANENNYRAQQLLRVKSMDPPSRNYDAVTVTVVQRPTRKSLVQASYTYSKERGNYPGLFSTETLQLDPNITSQYDLPSLLANRFGYLGLDRTHLVKVDAFYQFDFKAAGLLVPGISFRAQSGIPQNALGRDPVYGQGEAYLMPRGSMGRAPVTKEVDIKIQYGRRIGKNNTVWAFMDVFNLFNSQDSLTVDQNYTFDGSLPIVGGNTTDLTHLKAHLANGAATESSQTVHLNPNYGVSTSHQAPASFRFGVRLSF